MSLTSHSTYDNIEEDPPPLTLDVSASCTVELLDSYTIAPFIDGYAGNVFISGINNASTISVLVEDLSTQKKCQLVYPDEVGENKLVCFMGLLHVEMSSEECVGNLLVGSGWDRMFSIAKVFTSGIPASLLGEKHVKRNRHAYLLTFAWLHILEMEAYKEHCQEVSKPHKSIEVNFLLGAGFLNDLSPLQHTQSNVHEAFMKGQFVVQNSKKKFSFMALDQSHEHSIQFLKADSTPKGLYGQKEEKVTETSIPEVLTVIDDFEHVQVDFHDTQNKNNVLEITPGPKLLDISYNYVSAQDNANTVVSIAPSKPHDVEISTEANFKNEIKPQAVPDSYTTNVDDSPYVEEPFQDSGSFYAPSEEYGSDSTSDLMEKAPDEEQESSRFNDQETNNDRNEGRKGRKRLKDKHIIKLKNQIYKLENEANHLKEKICDDCGKLTAKHKAMKRENGALKSVAECSSKNDVCTQTDYFYKTSTAENMDNKKHKNSRKNNLENKSTLTSIQDTRKENTTQHIHNTEANIIKRYKLLKEEINKAEQMTL
ncbi:hypothetical protein FQA39_LY17179 [Lamprigera yunnana]|nr:hypothetical protein FQA39_LY17179 [Lamprigera yunnana]